MKKTKKTDAQLRMRFYNIYRKKPTDNELRQFSAWVSGEEKIKGMWRK